jgi:hypothetical protein
MPIKIFELVAVSSKCFDIPKSAIRTLLSFIKIFLECWR